MQELKKQANLLQTNIYKKRMILSGKENIREITLFPMNQNAQDLMKNAPSEVSENQLKELNLLLKKKK